jgi:hypothetical protein
MIRDTELKFLPHILDAIWGGYFFLFQKILLQWLLAAFTKLGLSKKQVFFRVCSVFSLFYSKGKRYKEKKKVPTPNPF